ncbi:MAG: SiaB family protein kinase [Bacteroidota bacterium]
MIAPTKTLGHFVTQDQRILISYKGPVTPVIMAEIGQDIPDLTADHPQASRKVFSIFMELAQNILYYSSEKIRYARRVDSVGMLQILELENHYVFSCGNTVNCEHVDQLIESCQTINSLDRDELQKLKRHKRRLPADELSKGAGVGLVQVAILADNPLEIQVQAIDDKYALFTLSVNINK